MDDRPMFWYRVLPKPPILNNEPPNEKARRDSSLLQHKIIGISSPSAPHPLVDNTPRRHSFDNVPLGDPRRPGLLFPTAREPLVHSSSPLGPLTRKRAALQMAGGELPTASPPASPPTSSAEPVTQFCLCQPDPKIPRPRNAFILYRQHYQGAVVRQHPGLANPEISKIIGEQWKHLSEKAKDEWKALAKEEKARHQQQYPNYRYRPRRNGRSSSNTIGSSSSESSTGADPSGNCSRCGGKIMNTPNTPNTPYTPGHPSTSISAPSGPFVRGRIASPPGSARPVRFDEAPRHRLSGPEMDMRERVRSIPPGPISPDPKRRRFNGSGVYIPVGNGRPMGPGSPGYPYSPRRDSLSRIEALHPRQPSYGMGPPIHRPLYRGEQDASLTLPPLQATAQQSNGNRNNIEAMVMTIPFINKIKLLAKVSPSLPVGSVTRPRGVVVAVEGQDAASVKTLLGYLEHMLKKDVDTFSVKVFHGPEPKASSLNDSGADPDRDATVAYFDTIATWHKISNDIFEFITIQPADSGTTAGNETGPQPQGDPMDEDSPTNVSPKSIVPGTKALNISSPRRSISAENNPAPETDASDPKGSMSESARKGPIPIALIPQFQLSTTDAAACSMPISDAYSPSDHWQWAATLWRGCVGPDITVYVRDCEREEVEKFGGGMPVEIRLQDAKTIVVRKVAGAGKDGELEEKALRRVGFEVEEFLRK